MEFVTTHKNADENGHLPDNAYITIEAYIDFCITERLSFHEFTDGLVYGIHENVFGRIIGGLTGLALGKAIGRFLIKSFEIREGTILFKLFSSRMFFLAVGAAFGKGSKSAEKPID